MVNPQETLPETSPGVARASNGYTYLIPPPPESEHPLLNQHPPSRFHNRRPNHATCEAARVEKRRHDQYLRGRERQRRMKGQIMAQLSLGREVPEEQIEAVFGGPIEGSDDRIPNGSPRGVGYPDGPQVNTGIRSKTPTLPNLARRLARQQAEAQVQVPKFDVPRVQFTPSVSMQSFVSLAEVETAAPCQQLWLVWEHDQRHRVALPDLLASVTERFSAPLNQILLIRQDELETRQRHIVRAVEDQFNSRYRDYYDKEYLQRWKIYARSLETALTESSRTIMKLRQDNLHLKEQTRNLKQEIGRMSMPHNFLSREDLSPPGPNTMKNVCVDESIEDTGDTTNNNGKSHEKNQKVIETENYTENSDSTGRLEDIEATLAQPRDPVSPQSTQPLQPSVGDYNFDSSSTRAHNPPVQESQPENPKANLSWRGKSLNEMRLATEVEIERMRSVMVLNPEVNTEDIDKSLHSIVMDTVNRSERAHNANLTYGCVVDVDEAGPIYDYRYLGVRHVGMRGGAGSPRDLQYYDSDSNDFSNSTNQNPTSCSTMRERNAGIKQKIIELVEDDNAMIDRSIPTHWGGMPITSSIQSSHANAGNNVPLSGTQSTISTGNSARSRWHEQSSSLRQNNDRCGEKGRRARLGRQKFGNPGGFAPAFNNQQLNNPNEDMSGFQYFRPLSNDTATSDWSSANGSKSPAFSNDDSLRPGDERFSPLNMTFENISNVKSAAGSWGTSEVSSQHDFMLSRFAFAGTSDVEKAIQAQAFRNDELHLAQKPMREFERNNSHLLSRNTGIIKQTIGTSSVTYEPKSDRRVRNVDHEGSYLGGDHNLPKKRQRRGIKEMIQERHRQIIMKSHEYRFYCSLSVAERAVLWARRNQPMKFWQDRPGVATEDVLDVTQIPRQYLRVYSRKRRFDRSISRARSPPHCTFQSESAASPFESYAHSQRSSRNASGTHQGSADIVSTRISHSQSDAKHMEDGFDAASSTKPSYAPSDAHQPDFRTDDDIKKLVRELLDNRSKYPVPGSISGQSRISQQHSSGTRSPTHGTSNATGLPEEVLTTVYAPELKPTQEIESLPLIPIFDPDEDSRFSDADIMDRQRQRVIQLETEDYFQQILEMNAENPRAVLVKLHSGPKFTPNAIPKRVFGGIIQEIQLFPNDRSAVIIFLFASEAAGFIQHVQKVKSNGFRQEITALQIEVDWYKNDISAIISSQPNILRHHLWCDATRTLRLHHISNDLRREQISNELGIRLGKLLISIVVVTPEQRYKQAQEGRQAIIEFASIKDAIESKKALENGLIDEYGHTKPVFAQDPALDGLNWEWKSYCDCYSCEESAYAGRKVTDESER